MTALLPTVEALMQLQFFQNALWAAVLSALVCGIIGAYVVVRRIVFISGGITHASFGGLGLGLYLGINPIFTAGITAVLAALGISTMSQSARMREDSAIASIWALGMALGVLFMTLTPGYTSGLSSYLFGNILLVSQQDLLGLLIMAIIVIALFSIYYRPILYSIFDADYARTRGIQTRRWDRLMLILAALSMVLSIRLVGIMLLLSLLSIPQSIMLLFSSDFKCVIMGSVVISLIANLSGLFASALLGHIPTGILIILILFVLLALAHLGKAIQKRSQATSPTYTS